MIWYITSYIYMIHIHVLMIINVYIYKTILQVVRHDVMIEIVYICMSRSKSGPTMMP